MIYILSFKSFLGFSWDFDGEKKFFNFTVLPFGLSSAGHIFTKVVRTLVKYWRSYSIPIVVYLDDGWASADFKTCLDISKFIRKTLDQSGFQVNFDKSQFFPTDKIVWLGFLWNLRDGVLEVPQEKIDNFVYSK